MQLQIQGLEAKVKELRNELSIKMAIANGTIKSLDRRLAQIHALAVPSVQYTGDPETLKEGNSDSGG